MNFRTTLFAVLAATAALTASPSRAHDPRDFDGLPQPRSMRTVPITCEELDAQGYSSYGSSADDDVAALRQRCDAEKKAEARKKKPAAAPVKKT